LNGTLHCDSDLGSGSVFIFNFPVDKIPKKEKEPVTQEIAEKRLKSRYDSDQRKTKVILKSKIPDIIEEDPLEDNSSVGLMIQPSYGAEELGVTKELAGRIIVAED
jgi:hypothetical protein